MSTETTKKKTSSTAKKSATKQETPKTETKAVQQVNGATESKAMQKIDSILKPSGKARVKRLQHAQILSDKYEQMADKYDDLTQFIAGKDNDNSNMKFFSANGYSFTLNNPTVIGKVLEVIETEFSNHLENAEKELLNFEV